MGSVDNHTEKTPYFFNRLLLTKIIQKPRDSIWSFWSFTDKKIATAYTQQFSGEAGSSNFDQSSDTDQAVYRPATQSGFPVLQSAS